MSDYRIMKTLFALFFICPISNLHAQSEPVSIGSKNGTLVVAGGGAGDEILKVFINAAGGKEAPIVCIPTAAGRREGKVFSGTVKRMIALGASNVAVLHTND